MESNGKSVSQTNTLHRRKVLAGAEKTEDQYLDIATTMQGHR